MTDNTYSGTLKFKDVDFVFVFDGSELVLIPPKERKNDIMWGWLKKEICPGVYTSGDPLTVDVPYLDGFCNETSKRLIFLTREESTVGSRNSTLYINVAGYLECSPNTNGFCRMTLSGRALNYIHPVNRAFSQVFDSDDLTEKGIISIRTNGFDRTSTVKRAFRFEGRDIAAYFSVGWTCSMKISTPPITLNSSMIFEFDETDDYWFFYRLWHAAEDFLKYLTFSKNTLIEDCSLQAMYDDSHYPRLGTPKSQDGWVDGVRCMLAARSGAVKARTSAINTARSLLTTAPEGLRSYRALMRPHEIRRPEDASGLVAARRAAKVSQVRAASILGTSEKYISMLERGQRELKPIRRAYEAWVEAGLPLDWDRQAFEAERKMDSKKHLAK